MLIGALVVLFPAASVAVAVTTYDPVASVTVVLNTGPGPATTVPTFAPPIRNWTPVTPTLSVALAVSVTSPASTVLASAGSVIETTGETESTGGGTTSLMVMVTVAVVEPTGFVFVTV